MVQSSLRRKLAFSQKTHVTSSLYPIRETLTPRLKNAFIQSPCQSTSPAPQKTECSDRLLSMGLSVDMTKIVSDKIKWLTVSHRIHMMQEAAVAAHFRLPSIETLVNKIHSRPRKTANPKLLVFDLDETLVHSAQDLQAPEHTIKVLLPSGVEQNVGVRIRPHALECLREASQMFEIAVFTASIESYAKQVIDILDPTGELIQHRLYRDSCHSVGPWLFKDLRIFREFALKDIILVDNSVFGFSLQLANGVPVGTWLDDPADEELLSLLPYLKVLRSLGDIRPFNYAVFSPLYAY